MEGNRPTMQRLLKWNRGCPGAACNLHASWDRSAGFPTCCIADFLSAAVENTRHAREITAPAGWKACATALLRNARMVQGAAAIRRTWFGIARGVYWCAWLALCIMV